MTETNALKTKMEAAKLDFLDSWGNQGVRWFNFGPEKDGQTATPIKTSALEEKLAGAHSAPAPVDKEACPQVLPPSPPGGGQVEKELLLFIESTARKNPEFRKELTKIVFDTNMER